MYIDAHAHIYHDFTDETAGRYLAKARGLGIERAAALAVGPTVFPGTNEWYAEQIRRFPDFFFGLANVDPDGTTVAELDALARPPWVGFKVLFARKPYGSPDYFPLWEQICAMGRPVLFHTGWLALSPRTRKVHMNNLRPMEVDFIARNFPDLKIILAHFGNPWWDEAACVVSRHPRVYADLSGGALRRSMALWKETFAPNGKADTRLLSKILWASDHSYLGAEFDEFRCVAFFEELLDACRAPSEIRERIYRQNAVELYGLKP